MGLNELSAYSRHYELQATGVATGEGKADTAFIQLMNQQVQEVHSAPPSSPPRFSKESQPDPIGDDGGGGGRYSASNYTYHRAYEHYASPLARAYSTESNDPAATTTTLSPHQLFSTPPSYQHDSRSDSYAGESGGGRGGPPPSFSPDLQISRLPRIAR